VMLKMIYISLDLFFTNSTDYIDNLYSKI